MCYIWKRNKYIFIYTGSKKKKWAKKEIKPNCTLLHTLRSDAVAFYSWVPELLVFLFQCLNTLRVDMFYFPLHFLPPKKSFIHQALRSSNRRRHLQPVRKYHRISITTHIIVQKHLHMYFKWKEKHLYCTFILRY